jgi:hypothetical protein
MNMRDLQNFPPFRRISFKVIELSPDHVSSGELKPLPSPVHRAPDAVDTIDQTARDETPGEDEE